MKRAIVLLCVVVAVFTAEPSESMAQAGSYFKHHQYATDDDLVLERLEQVETLLGLSYVDFDFYVHPAHLLEVFVLVRRDGDLVNHKSKRFVITAGERFSTFNGNGVFRIRQRRENNGIHSYFFSVLHNASYGAFFEQRLGSDHNHFKGLALTNPPDQAFSFVEVFHQSTRDNSSGINVYVRFSKPDDKPQPAAVKMEAISVDALATIRRFSPDNAAYNRP